MASILNQALWGCVELYQKVPPVKLKLYFPYLQVRDVNVTVRGQISADVHVPSVRCFVHFAARSNGKRFCARVKLVLQVNSRKFGEKMIYEKCFSNQNCPPEPPLAPCPTTDPFKVLLTHKALHND